MARRIGYLRGFAQRPLRTARRARPAIDNPVAFANLLKRGEGYRMHPYQEDSIRCQSPRKCHCDGRDVGKTTEIEVTHLFFALTHPGQSSMICAQWQHNLAPTMERLVALCKSHPLLAPRTRRVVRSPFYRIEFDNGSLLLGKIAGHRGVNFQNTHVDLISVDEAQNLVDASWDELLPALNAGGRLHVYGVPNGVRNRFHAMAHDTAFARFHWPSAINPAFTSQKDAELQRLYGGAESEGYIHNVLGQHGSPASCVFDLALIERCLEDRDEPHLVLDAAGATAAPQALRAVLDAAQDQRILLGADVGYARDPTIFVLWAAQGGEAPDTMRLASRGIVELRRTPYADQAHVAACLMRHTDAVALGCDRGGGGTALLQSLAAQHPDLLPRVIRAGDGEPGLPFNESLTLTRAGVTLRQRMKPATTGLYLQWMQEGRVRLGRSARLEQMAGHTYRRNERGEVIYAKGDDHILDADRAALYWLLQQSSSANGSRYRPPRLDDV